MYMNVSPGSVNISRKENIHNLSKETGLGKGLVECFKNLPRTVCPNLMQ